MPSTEELVTLISEQEIADYHRDGFLLLDRPLISPEALLAARDELDRAFDHFGRLAPHYARDLTPGARVGDTPRIPEIDVPSKMLPKLKDSPILNVCVAIARQLQGPRARSVWDHAIYKPPLNEAATPWHQDAAYGEEGADSLAMWVPLQDVGIEDGCMQFVPGSKHAGLVAHSHLASESHPMLLGAQVDQSTVVTCPVHAGGLVIHNVMTLHSTGPNLGANIRRAWVINFATQPPNLRSKLYALRLAINRSWLFRG